MFCLVDKIPAFEDCPFFAKVAFSVDKKKGLKAKVVSVFCVIEPFNRLELLIPDDSFVKKKSLITLTKKKII
jgi:hypothetical protein